MAHKVAFLKANNINLYYEQHGKGDDLVLISGLSADHNTWEYVLPILTPYYRVTIFDNRGVGQTDAPNEAYSIEQMADDTAALMDALSIEKAHVAGHSMGGMIAEQLAVHHPDKVNKLMVVCSRAAPYSRNILWSRLNKQLQKARVPAESLMTAIAITCYSARFLEKQENIDWVIQRALNHSHPQSLIGARRQSQACADYDALESLKSIQQDTLVIAGDDDILTPLSCSKDIVTHIHKAKLAILPGGHVMQLENPKGLAKMLHEFIG